MEAAKGRFLKRKPRQLTRNTFVLGQDFSHAFFMLF